MDEVLRDLRIIRIKMAMAGLTSVAPAPGAAPAPVAMAPPSVNPTVPPPPAPIKLDSTPTNSFVKNPTPKAAADGGLGALPWDRRIIPKVRETLAKPVAWQPPVEEAASASSNAAHNRKAIFSGIGDWFKNVYLAKYKPVLPKIETESVPGYLLKRPVGTPPKGTPMMMAPKPPPSLALRGMLSGYNRPRSRTRTRR